jgi:hypothetical protein
VYLTLILGAAERWLWGAVYAAQVLLLLRLYREGLHRRYRFFAGYLAAQVAEASVLLLLRQGTTAYGVAYVAFAPVIGLCTVLAALEVYDLVLRDYPGIRTLGRWAVSGGLVAALAIAGLTLAPDLSNPAEAYPLMRSFHVFQRALYSALLLFVVFISAFLVWFPVPLTRNAVLHTIVFTVSFAGKSVALLLRNVGGVEFRLISSTLNLAIAACCLAAWTLFLTQRGEQQTVVFGHRWRPEDSDRLVKQLDSINATLLRSARRR